MISRRLEPLLFGLVLSGVMSLLVSGISAFHVTGPVPGFARMWLGAWLTAWRFSGGVAGGAACAPRRAAMGGAPLTQAARAQLCVNTRRAS